MRLALNVIEWISLAGAAIAFLLAWIALAGTRALRRRAKVRRRMGAIGSLLASETREPAGKAVGKPARERKAARENALIGRLNARYPLSGGIRTTAIAGTAGLVAFAALVPSMGFFGLPGWPTLLVSAVAGIAIGWNVGTAMEDARRAEFSDRFLIALEDFQRMVRFGIASNQALHSIAGSAVEPVKGSLRNIVLETEFGVPMGAAMEREAFRIRISELSMLAAVVSTQSSTGGNLSESIANLAATLRERMDNRSRLKAATAESRVTMIILAFVPVAAIGLQAATQPELVEVLLGGARHLFGIGILLILTGLAISWKMIQSAQR